MIDKDFEQLEKENIQWQKFNTSQTPSRNIFEFSNLFLGVLEVHQKPIEHDSGIIKHKYDLKDPYYAWLVNISGVVQYEDAPRTGTMKGFVLERITIVSANVQGGNKERMWRQIVDVTCDIKLFGIIFSFNFGAHPIWINSNIWQTNAFFVLSLTESFTTASPCQSFYGAPNPWYPFRDFAQQHKLCETQKNSSSVYIKLSKRG